MVDADLFDKLDCAYLLDSSAFWRFTGVLSFCWDPQMLARLFDETEDHLAVFN